MSDKNWNNDTLQFARLLAELNAAGVFNIEPVVESICNSMDLKPVEVWSIVNRAERQFEKDKRSK
jgi:predicted transcriptional regulator YheO